MVRKVFFLLAVCVLVGRCALAQSPNPDDVSDATGQKPLMSYQGVLIDRVDVFSGNLHVEIPLVTLHGRAHDTTLRLIYNSLVWKTYPDRVNGPLTKCDLEAWSNPSLGWNLTANSRGGKVTNYIFTPTTSGNHYETADLIDVDGSKHVLAGILGSICNNCARNTKYDSTDSTYIRLTAASSVVGVSEYNDVIAYKDAVSFIDSTPNQITDTNGNFIDRDTLGRTFTYAPSGPQPTSISYTASDGSNATIQLTYGTYPLNCSGNPINNGETAQLLTSVTLANGEVYQLQYNSVAELSKIFLPTGGYIRYTYGGGHSNDLAVIRGAVSNRAISVDGSTEQTWTYSSTPVAGTATTITDPSGNQEIHLYTGLAGYENEVDYKDSTGHLLQSVTKAYQQDDLYGLFDGNARLTSITKILDSGQQSQVAYTYGSDGNVSIKQESDYGQGAPGAPLRKTTFSYLHDTNSSYLNTHILDRIANQSIYNPASPTTPLSQTLFTYDSTALTPITGAIAHDDVKYPATNTVRGNLTKTQRWLIPTIAT
jgi:YD repeat-containing protein